MKALSELRLRLQRRALDRRLLEGADPHSWAELERRAEELVSSGFRRRMAVAIRRTIEVAERPWPGPWSPQVPVQSEASWPSARRSSTSRARSSRSRG